MEIRLAPSHVAQGVGDAKRRLGGTVDLGRIELAGREAVTEPWTTEPKVTDDVAELAFRRVRGGTGRRGDAVRLA